jgi:hypothetical protein
MKTKDFSAVAATLIDGFDNTAHHAIEAWRDGGERLGQAAKQRWDAALKESSPQLSAETRKNAQHAQQVFGGYYTKAIDMSTSGAAVAVDTLVQAARVAVQRASSWQQTRA